MIQGKLLLVCMTCSFKVFSQSISEEQLYPDEPREPLYKFSVDATLKSEFYPPIQFVVPSDKPQLVTAYPSFAFGVGVGAVFRTPRLAFQTSINTGRYAFEYEVAEVNNRVGQVVLPPNNLSPIAYVKHKEMNYLSLMAGVGMNRSCSIIQVRPFFNAGARYYGRFGTGSGFGTFLSPEDEYPLWVVNYLIGGTADTHQFSVFINPELHTIYTSGKNSLVLKTGYSLSVYNNFITYWEYLPSLPEGFKSTMKINDSNWYVGLSYCRSLCKL